MSLIEIVESGSKIMDSRDIVIYTQAADTYKRNMQQSLKENHSSAAEDAGRFAGLAFRALEKVDPWPGEKNITSLAKEKAKIYGVDVSYARWSPGIYEDSGFVGCPFAYIACRNYPGANLAKQICYDLDLAFTALLPTKDGLWMIEAEAFRGKWEKWYLNLNEGNVE